MTKIFTYYEYNGVMIAITTRVKFNFQLNNHCDPCLNFIKSSRCQTNTKY